jgi:hypothetical protein
MRRNPSSMPFNEEQKGRIREIYLEGFSTITTARRKRAHVDEADGWFVGHYGVRETVRRVELPGAASGLRQRAGGTDPPSSARHEPIVCVARNRSQSRCWHTSVDTTLR